MRVTDSIINGEGELGMCVSIKVCARARELGLGISPMLIKLAVYKMVYE